MLSVEAALSQILSHVSPLEAETVALEDCLGRVLATDIQAPHNLPPFSNSAMDGFAVIAADVENASPENPITLSVIEDIPAGYHPEKTLSIGQAARIMTGAPIPNGANAVVPVEKTTANRSDAELPTEIGILSAVSLHAHIRPAGEDVQKGETVLEKGHLIRPVDIGILAALGVSQVPVLGRPQIAVLSSGDELIKPDEPLRAGKIRDTNSYVIPALIEQYGAIPLRLGVARDNLEDVRAHFQKAIDSEADLIVSSAGVSVGAFDFVKAVLEEMGTAHFWKVNMRPRQTFNFWNIG